MKEFLNFRNGTYIEAGANNGLAQSNTSLLEQYMGWSGLLIEPNKYRFNECMHNRSHNNYFANVALVSFEHKEEHVCGNFNEVDINDSLVSQITTPLDYYDSHQLVATKEKSETRQVIQVIARTLQHLIDECKITHIDFLSLDVEGYEKEAINGIDLLKNPPTYIQIETSTFQYRIDDMTNFMSEKGYKFLGMSNFNDCFYGHIKND